jgi:chromosome segregation ATPase
MPSRAKDSAHTPRKVRSFSRRRNFGLDSGRLSGHTGEEKRVKLPFRKKAEEKSMKFELEKQRLAEITRLRGAIQESGATLARHRSDLAAEDSTLASNRAEYERECRSLALGEPDRAELTAVAIVRSEARRNGLAGLIAERTNEISSLERQLAALQQEQDQFRHSVACDEQLKKMPELAARLDVIVAQLEKDVTAFLATYAELAGQNFLTSEARAIAVPRARASFEHADAVTYRLITCAQRIAADPERFVGHTEKMVVEGRFV